MMHYSEKSLAFRTDIGDGERTVKLTGDNNVIDINASQMLAAAVLTELTIYPSPYMVLSNRGYTKHYYVGADRLCARIGGGGLEYPLSAPGLSNRASALFGTCLAQCNARELDANTPECIRAWISDIDETMQTPLEDAPQRFEAQVEVDLSDFEQSSGLIPPASQPGQTPPEPFNPELPSMPNGNSGNTAVSESEPEAYFYHGDHLGSASWITDDNGVPVQHLQLNCHARFSSTPSKASLELRILLELVPYCAWNPQKPVDPDGREIWI